MISERALRRLAAQFVALAGEGAFNATFRRRWGRLVEFQPLLEQERLSSLTDSEAMALYRASGSREPDAFAANPIAEVRDALDFLLYDETKLEGRFEEAAVPDGGYGLKGVGREFCSYALTVKDPGLFALWDVTTDKGLKLLDHVPPFTDSAFGVQYVDTLNALWEVRAAVGLPDFIQVDLMLRALASRKLHVGG